MNAENVKSIAKDLLAQGHVAAVIGYAKDRMGFRVSPCVARNEADADRLMFSPLCSLSLVNYLTLEKGSLIAASGAEEGKKVAIMARGCDSRALNQLISERGIRRDNLVIIGVPCPGVIDLKKLEARFPDAAGAVDLAESGDTYTVTVNGETHAVSKADLLATHCKKCAYPNPLVYDVLADEPVAQRAAEYSDVEDLEKLPVEERAIFWNEALSKCVRCYACRNVCPLCYCEGCILERITPPWMFRSVNLPENMAFHLTRAFHLASRCSGCGECERACPVGVPLMALNRKMEKDVQEIFQYTAGMDPEQKPLLSTFDPKDKESFIL